jgi:hypothetical protein
MRARRTKEAMQTFRESIYAIVEANQPCSVRQVYYMGIGRFWDKDQGGSRRSYNDAVRNLGIMRESGMIPWGWITDSTRYVRIATMYDSPEHAMQRWAESYRRDLWACQPRRVEVWAESDSTAGLVDSVTRPLGVGLYSCRGQASKDFAYTAAEMYREVGKPVTILYLGDWDPAGLAIPRSLTERLHRYSKGEVHIDFRRIAVTPDDVHDLNLITHDVNTKDPNYKHFVEECHLVGLAPQLATEVEAVPPPVLRQRLEERLYDLVENVEGWNATLAYEESEREIFGCLARQGVPAL